MLGGNGCARAPLQPRRAHVYWWTNCYSNARGSSGACQGHAPLKAPCPGNHHAVRRWLTSLCQMRLPSRSSVCHFLLASSQAIRIYSDSMTTVGQLTNGAESETQLGRQALLLRLVETATAYISKYEVVSSVVSVDVGFTVNSFLLF